MYMGPKTFAQYGEAMRLCLEDACAKLLIEERESHPDSPIHDCCVEDLGIYQWTQMWSDTSCGFGGIGGQAITTAPTLAICDTRTGSHVVYHAFRFAYLVKHPSEAFFSDMYRWHLLGKADKRGHYEKAKN